MRTKILYLLLLIPSISIAQVQEPDLQKALQTLKQLITSQQFRDKDIQPGDTSQLFLGAPIRVGIVPLDKLRSYKSGQSAKELITDINKMIVPVLKSNRTVVSSISTEMINNKWVVSGFGIDEQVSQKIDSINNASRKLVRILSLRLDFLSFEDATGLNFIPLQDDRERNILIGRPLKAETVLLAYVKAANDYNGLPW